MKRRIGILLDRQVWNAMKSRRSTGNEKIGLYNQASKRLGLRPFYMTLREIERSKAVGLIRSGNRYKRVRRAIPSVIHNRTIVSRPVLSRKLRQLSKGRMLFNRQNRYSKYRIHKLLTKRDSSLYRVPLTIRLSRERLSNAMEQEMPLYIKPMKGSIGEGIIRLSYRGQGKWKLQSGARQIRYGSAKRTIERVMKLAGKKRYMIQEAIALAKYDGRPYDLRVTVQRGERGSWQVTGIFGKVAAPGRHVTNVAKGGSVKRVRTLFKASGLHPDAMERMITQASLDIAEYLGQRLPGLADIGLDLGIDHSGKIYFIEMNGRDQRIGFKKAGMKDVFYRSYETPLRYARYLLGESGSSGGTVGGSTGGSRMNDSHRRQ
jgi:hypothetical protein